MEPMMKKKFLNVVRPTVTIGFWILSISLALGADAGLMKAKKAAEAKGYIFEISHDEIVAKAKKEGKLRVLIELVPTFRKDYRRSVQEKVSFY